MQKNKGDIAILAIESSCAVSYTHLVHISQMSERYIKHPLEVVSVGDIVEVKVMSVDLKKQRIQLTMKL